MHNFINNFLLSVIKLFMKFSQFKKHGISQIKADKSLTHCPAKMSTYLNLGKF